MPGLADGIDPGAAEGAAIEGGLADPGAAPGWAPGRTSGEPKEHAAKISGAAMAKDVILTALGKQIMESE
ncbi:MAG: hypothetical protein J4O08_07425 [Chloroflexi bacterium]|nr:hypothetical protein [Chloroflexota bacterium]